MSSMTDKKRNIALPLNTLFSSYLLVEYSSSTSVKVLRSQPINTIFSNVEQLYLDLSNTSNSPAIQLIIDYIQERLSSLQTKTHPSKTFKKVKIASELLNLYREHDNSATLQQERAKIEKNLTPTQKRYLKLEKYLPITYSSTQLTSKSQTSDKKPIETFRKSLEDITSSAIALQSSQLYKRTIPGGKLGRLIVTLSCCDSPGYAQALAEQIEHKTHVRNAGLCNMMH